MPKKKSASRAVLPTRNMRSPDSTHERQCVAVTHSVSALVPPDAVIGDLILQCRIRRQVLRARTRLSNQLDAQERLITGTVKGGKAAKNKFVISPASRTAAEHVRPVLAVHLHSLADAQKPYDKAIARLAKQLPVWAWAEQVRGCGPLVLGLIVGETGDLAQYDGPAKVWKRMGLAVMPDGTRQRRVAGDEAIAHGYNPQRRSLMFNLGECLIKLNQAGPYRRFYDERKAFELARLPADAKGRQGWAHARASRYMQKRFLVDLWEAWRQRVIVTQPDDALAS